MNGLILAHLVADGTTAGADRATDESTLAAAQEPTNDSTASRRTSNDLQTGVVTMIVCSLSSHSSLVGGLGEGNRCKSQGKCKRKSEVERLNFHWNEPSAA